MRLALILTAVLASLVVVPVLGAADKPAPVSTLKVKPFGKVLTTRGGKALYRWSVEQKVGNKVRCTRLCAQQWPPLIIAKGTKIAAHRAGYTGRFGTIRRPDGRLQLTYRGMPLYSYHDDPVGVVLCDNVDGWFVVRP